MKAVCSVEQASTAGMPALLHVIGFPSAQLWKAAYSVLHVPVLSMLQAETQEA